MPGGFLVPGHATGAIEFVSLDGAAPVKLTTDKKNYFYHITEWIDFNGDGRLDLLTARTTLNAETGEMLWLEQPATYTKGQAWEEHHITDGPSVHFTIAELDGDNSTIEIIACEFFDNRISLIVINRNGGGLISRRVFDDTLGPAYMSQVVDLNGDGKLDILATNHEKKEADSHVYAYEIPEPSQWATAEFKRHVIASNFKPVKSMFVPQMAPGFAYAMFPHKETANTKGARPHIVIAGDGDFSAWMMTPVGGVGSFEFDKTLIKEEKGTVGSIALGDVTGNGFMDVLIPNYDKGYIELWQCSEADEEPLKSSFLA